MYSLLLIKNETPIINFSLDGETTIGRSSKCEIQIIDAQSSRRHAVVYEHQEGAWLQDLNSQNGTYYEGNKITQPVRLEKNSEIRIGEHVFLFNSSIDVIHAPQNQSNIIVVDTPSSQEALALEPEVLNRLELSSWKLIYDVTMELLGSVDVNQMLQQLLDKLIKQFSAQRGFVLLRNHPQGKFLAVATCSDNEKMGLSRSLLNRVVKTKTALLLNNAIENVSFVGAKSVVEHNLRSVMIAPIMHMEQLIGVVQLDSQKAHFYTQTHLASLQLIAQAAAMTVYKTKQSASAQKQIDDLNLRQTGQNAFVGNDPQILQLLAKTAKAAKYDSKILIEGESGTGKELIAKTIHEQSNRCTGPYIALNCAAIPEHLLESALLGHEKGAFTGAAKKKAGCFELADGGTLFLDEIGELDASLQVKLLRVIQEQCFYRLGAERPIQVDVRLVAATNQHLEQRVAEGAFREDLFFRLNVITLQIPPLRSRRNDIELLANFFLQKFCNQMGRPVPRLMPNAIDALKQHPWPGNVRELQNTMERVLVFCDNTSILSDDLSLGNHRTTVDQSQKVGNLHQILRETEKQVIKEALLQTKGKKTTTCQLLEISRPTLDKKIADYELEF